MDTAENEKLIIAKLDELKIKNYIFSGGFKEAESKILILFPEKLDEEIIESNLDNIINAIKVKLPNELKGKYKHGD